MVSQNRRLIFGSALFLLLALQACQADLMCYVCEDCLKVNAETPLLECNENYFNNQGSTEASTDTTTTALPTVGDGTTTTEVETTADTTETTSNETTEAPIPTPPTVGPVETTTGMPTPPEENLFRKFANVTRLLLAGNESSSSTNTLSSTTPLPSSSSSSSSSSTTRSSSSSSSLPPTTMPPTTVPVSTVPVAFVPSNVSLASNFSLANVRSRRSLDDSDISYHCYSVQKNVNGVLATERGCSRVSTFQGVCQLLQEQNTGSELRNCNPCTMNRCNGSGALQASLLTLLLVGVAALLQRSN